MATQTLTHRDPKPDYHLDLYGATQALARCGVPLGRLFFVAIFLTAAPMHFSSDAIRHAADQGVPMAQFLVPASGVIALVGGLSVLLGFHTRFGALLLVVFLVPVTLMMHKFWTLTDPTQVMIQRVMFMKNVSMLGAALMLCYFGGGPFSLDRRV